MDFELSDEQRAIQETARAFAAERLKPCADEWDAKGLFPDEALRAGAALGFGGICIGEDVGGSALSRVDSTILFEELAGGCTSTAAYISIHNIAAWMIDAYGTPEQRRRWLPGLCRMDHFASYCLTEPEAGSDAAALRTRADRQGDHYVLNGSKAFISGGSRSDVYACMVRTGGAGAGGITCVIVEAGTPGLSFGRPEKKMGWNSQPTSMVVFADCRVPVVNRIGAEGEGFKIAMRGLDGGRLNIAACSLGAARACLEAAQSYLKTRRQFGRTLAEFQALQFKLADMATELTAARLLVRYAASRLDRDAETARAVCAMAKRYATDVGFAVVNDALQLHGGSGYMREVGIERFLRDVRVHQILEGTNEIMRVIVAHDLLGADGGG